MFIPNNASQLWPNKSDSFFSGINLKAVQQIGGTCVSTSLAILSNKTPEYFQSESVNTQNPVTWSKSLEEFGMKLAFCPSDIRKIGFYMDELVAYNDLFAVCYYTSQQAKVLLSDPDAYTGWICGSHIVILSGDSIFDPARGDKSDAYYHESNIYHSKRIFRIVPVDFHGGL